MILLSLIIIISYSSGMYLGGEKIGYTIIDIKPEADGYTLEEEMFMRIDMLEQERSMEVKSVYKVDNEYRLKNFSFQLETYSQTIASYGEVKDNYLIYNVKTGGREMSKSTKLDGDLYVSQVIPYIVSTNRSNCTLSIFDPTILAVNKAEVTILEDKGDSIKYQTEILGARSVTWVGRNGEVLRSEEPMDVTVKREGIEKAREFGEKPPEILSMFAIPAGMELIFPRNLTYLKAIVRGRFKITDRQRLLGDTLIVEKIVPDEGIKTIPRPLFGCSCSKLRKVPQELEKYLESTPLIQVNDKKIRNMSAQIVRGVRDDWDKVVKITNWVSQNVEDYPSATIPSALDVMESLKGDCNEHATLFVALSRAAGIPTDISVGLVYMNEYFYYHAWNKVWVGKWIEVDPTFNQPIADATHITLEEGGLQDWAKIMDLVGNIEIEVIGYK